jgi:hypothetical protein
MCYLNRTGALSFVMAAMLRVCMLCLIGCGSTYQARSAKTSGFLGDYSMLRKGGSGEALLVYIDTEADFKAYGKVLMEPIKVYTGKDGKLAKLPKKDVKRIVDYLDATIREQLKKDYTLTDQAGPDVMRLRVAVTEAEASAVVMDTVSSIIPVGVALSTLKRAAFGSHLSVGRAGVEAELQDSVSGKRLLAAVDRQVGRKYTAKFDKFEKWHAVQSAFDHWAVRLKERLTELRTGSAKKKE